jgi:hypothetical protein
MTDMIDAWLLLCEELAAESFRNVDADLPAAA